MDIVTIFGNNIRSKREKLGLSQETLAEKSSLHRTYIGAVERGERNITLRSANRIAEALHEDLKNLFSEAT